MYLSRVATTTLVLAKLKYLAKNHLTNLAKDHERGNLRDRAKHSCELPKTSNSHLPRLPPNAKLLARLKRTFQKLIHVSDKHPFTRLLLRSRAAVASEKKRHARSAYWWIIHPCSNLRFAWEIFMTVIFLYLFITVPYVNAFYRICNKIGVDKLYFLYPAYVICLADIAMNFITGFTSEDGHEFFLEPTLIASHYCRGYFLIDLLTSVPYTWFTSGTLIAPGPNGNFPKVIAESLLLLKLLRLYTLRNYTKKICMVFKLTDALETGIWLCIFTALIFHWSACVTYAFPFFVLHATRTTIEDSDAYAVKSGLYVESSSRIYLMSLHMGVSNLVGSSFVEFKQTSHADKMIRCLLRLFGVGYTIYLIVIVLQLVESLAKPKLKYQEMMYQVNEYIDDKKLPEHLKKRLIDYYEYRFQGNYFKENAVFRTLSNHLRQEINVRLCHGLLETATIFHTIPRAVLGNLMASLKPVIYLRDDVIFKCKMEGESMYFISSGTVAVVNYLGKELCHLEDGNYFGELILLYPQRRRDVTVIAIEVCELLRLDRRDFKRLVMPSMEFYKRLEKIAKERLDHIMRINKISESEERRRRKLSTQYGNVLMNARKNGRFEISSDDDENTISSVPRKSRITRNFS